MRHWSVHKIEVKKARSSGNILGFEKTVVLRYGGFACFLPSRKICSDLQAVCEAKNLSSRVRSNWIEATCTDCHSTPRVLRLLHFSVDLQYPRDLPLLFDSAFYFSFRRGLPLFLCTRPCTARWFLLPRLFHFLVWIRFIARRARDFEVFFEFTIAIVKRFKGPSDIAIILWSNVSIHLCVISTRESFFTGRNHPGTGAQT